MYEVSDLWLIAERLQPFQQFPRVGMVAELFESYDLRPDGNWRRQKFLLSGAPLLMVNPRVPGA